MLEVLQPGLHPHGARQGPRRSAAILFLHALKNAAVPIVTVIGIGIALLIGGAVVTESVFAIPGLGRLTVDAILRRDYPVIQGVVLLFSFVYVLVNLASTCSTRCSIRGSAIERAGPRHRRAAGAASRPRRAAGHAAAGQARGAGLAASCAAIRPSPSAARCCR